ncbi:flotillin domain-containing protein, partial [Arthrobacter sp. Hiyo1]
AKSLAEADGIKARAEALGTNQEAVISQQLAENMPAIVAAAAEPFAHVGNLTVLNGGEGLNSMVGGILSQVGNYLPSITAALKNGKEPPKRPTKTPDA